MLGKLKHFESQEEINKPIYKASLGARQNLILKGFGNRPAFVNERDANKYGSKQGHHGKNLLVEYLDCGEPYPGMPPITDENGACLNQYYFLVFVQEPLSLLDFYNKFRCKLCKSTF